MRRQIERKTLLQQPAVLVGADEAIADGGDQRGQAGNKWLDDRKHQRMIERDGRNRHA